MASSIEADAGAEVGVAAAEAGVAAAGVTGVSAPPAGTADAPDRAATRPAPQAPAHGSVAGLVICLVIGFAAYALLSALAGLPGLVSGLDYAAVIDGISSSVPKQLLWFLMDFTEPEFYASVFAGAGVIMGGAVAYLLSRRGSRLAGFEICYGAHRIFPWVLLSQVLSLALTIFVFRYIEGFDASADVTFVATFVPIVASPPATMLLYGPSVPALLVSSVLAGLMCSPVASWISAYVVTPLGLPGVVANVAAMAVTGFVIFMVLKALPWVRKVPIEGARDTLGPVCDVSTTGWFVRRVIAEFSEAPFYGNEVASLFELAGLVIGCVVCPSHSVNGSSEALAAIVLSQFVAASVGVFLYASKFANGGWYATYVPVVSTAPACVLAFGASVPVAVFAGVLGGVLGGPVAEFFSTLLPEDVHATVANVASMALVTALVYAVMSLLPWF